MHRPYMTSRRARNTFCRVPGETYQLLSRQLQVHGHIRETSLDGAGGCGVGVLCFTPHVSCPATVLRGSLSTLIIERKEMTRKSSAFHRDEKLEKQIAGVWDFGGYWGARSLCALPGFSCAPAGVDFRQCAPKQLQYLVESSRRILQSEFQNRFLRCFARKIREKISSQMADLWAT